VAIANLRVPVAARFKRVFAAVPCWDGGFESHVCMFASLCYVLSCVDGGVYNGPIPPLRTYTRELGGCGLHWSFMQYCRCGWIAGSCHPINWIVRGCALPFVFLHRSCFMPLFSRIKCWSGSWIFFLICASLSYSIVWNRDGEFRVMTFIIPWAMFVMSLEEFRDIFAWF
jgi:hypothetical protein